MIRTQKKCCENASSQVHNFSHMFPRKTCYNWVVLCRHMHLSVSNKTSQSLIFNLRKIKNQKHQLIRIVHLMFFDLQKKLEVRRFNFGIANFDAIGLLSTTILQVCGTVRNAMKRPPPPRRTLLYSHIAETRVSTSFKIKIKYIGKEKGKKCIFPITVVCFDGFAFVVLRSRMGVKL